MCKNKDARDIYTILAFVFLSLTLLVRAVTIIPIVIEGEDFDNNSSYCERVVFSATPLLTFLIAAMINTYRWYDIGVRSLEQRSLSLPLRVICQLVLWYFVALLPTGYVMYCVPGTAELARVVFLYSAVFSYTGMHVILIAVNLYLIVFISLKFRRRFPYLYNKVKLQMYLFLSFIVVLLTVRVTETMVVFFLKEHNIEIVSSFELAALLGVTEIIPCVMVLISFVLFTGKTDGTLESLDNNLVDSNIQNSGRSFSQSLLFGRNDITIFEEENAAANTESDKE